MSLKKLLIRFARPAGRKEPVGKTGDELLETNRGRRRRNTVCGRVVDASRGNRFLPRWSPTFEYTYPNFDIWRRQAGIYVSDAREHWLRHYCAEEGDVIVEVGAGRGEDTLAFSRAVGKTGRVIAIEAHPGTYAILRRFCRLNGLSNVTPLHLAAMDKPVGYIF